MLMVHVPAPNFFFFISEGEKKNIKEQIEPH